MAFNAAVTFGMLIIYIVAVLSSTNSHTEIVNILNIYSIVHTAKLIEVY